MNNQAKLKSEAEQAWRGLGEGMPRNYLAELESLSSGRWTVDRHRPASMVGWCIGRVLDPSYHLCGVDPTLSYLYTLDVVNVANKVRISCSYLELIDVCFEFARRKSL